MKANMDTLERYSETLEKERSQEKALRLKIEEEYN